MDGTEKQIDIEKQRKINEFISAELEYLDHMGVEEARFERVRKEELERGQEAIKLQELENQLSNI